MNTETYTAAQGLIARQIQLDNISNNIANASTTGFREVSPFFRSFNRALNEGPANPLNNVANNQPVIAGVFFHSKQGPVKQTGNSLDMAIDGDGFFKVNTPFGQRYTRNGNFNMDVNGTLKTSAGYDVLGIDDQPIVLRSDLTEVHINSQGKIVQSGQEVGQVKLVTFQDKSQFIPEADTLLAMQDPVAVEQASTAKVMGGTLESSNVNLAKQMVDMITAQRAYDVNIRTIRTIDSSLNQGAIQGFGPR